MPKVRVHNFTISVDGYGAGPDQSLDTPLGIGGEELHEWMFRTRAWHEMHGDDGGETGLDDRFMAAGHEGIGAFVMGRNMFGPIRGPWGDDDWKGWWGDNPPYHHDVYVLTHHDHDPIEMAGGTTFHFVTDGPEAALDRARASAGEQDVLIAGGASTIQQYLRAGSIDELHVVISPRLLGRGERLFDGLDTVPDRYDVVDVVASPSRVAHVRLARKGGG
jgi:dihydrofolate reductase